MKPEEKPLLGGEGLQRLTARVAYHVLNLVQAPFAFLFWLIEQRKAWLQDQLAKEGNTR
jgi:hypothetical protein